MLFPHSYKKIGWLLLFPSLIAGIYLMATGYDSTEFKVNMFVLFSDEIFGNHTSFGIAKVDIVNTAVAVVFIVACLLVGFSRERVEDEYIRSLRLDSLVWAVFINYVLLIVAFLFIYGTSFLNVMVYNMFTTLLLFIARFHYLLFRNTNALADEK